MDDRFGFKLSAQSGIDSKSGIDYGLLMLHSFSNMHFSGYFDDSDQHVGSKNI